MAMLYMRRPLPANDLDLYIKPTSRSEKELALEQLRRYHVLVDETNRLNTPRAYKLTTQFAKSLRQVLTGTGGSTESFGEVYDVPAHEKVSVGTLDQFARTQWEGILGYMVGSSAIPLDEEVRQSDPAPAVIEILRSGHLIELSGASISGSIPKITKEGFAFVLKDINTQVWTLLFLFVARAEDLDMQNVEVLSFLFLVASLDLGTAYSTTALTDNQNNLLEHFRALGIVYLEDVDPDTAPEYFYPTRLATGLTSDSSSALSSTAAANLNSSLNTSSVQGFIIIETNYRVYAYTSSTLQIALLSLFVNLRSRHPNLVTGKMTKSSIQRAVQRGITAEQIISYLTSHAHPQMRRHAAAEAAAAQARTGGVVLESVQRPVSIIPATILDQIHLWQLERDRMTTTNGFLLKDFATKSEYDDVRRYTDEIGVLVWKDDKKQLCFVNQIDSVKRFMQDRKERRANMNASTTTSAAASSAATPSGGGGG